MPGDGTTYYYFNAAFLISRDRLRYDAQNRSGRQMVLQADGDVAARLYEEVMVQESDDRARRLSRICAASTRAVLRGQSQWVHEANGGRDCEGKDQLTLAPKISSLLRLPPSARQGVSHVCRRRSSAQCCHAQWPL